METSYPNPSFKTISKWVNVKKEGSFGFANMAVFTNYQLPRKAYIMNRLWYRPLPGASPASPLHVFSLKYLFIQY